LIKVSWISGEVVLHGAKSWIHFIHIYFKYHNEYSKDTLVKD